MLQSWSCKIASVTWVDAKERHTLVQSSSCEDRTEMVPAALYTDVTEQAGQPPRLHLTHASCSGEASGVVVRNASMWEREWAVGALSFSSA